MAESHAQSCSTTNARFVTQLDPFRILLGKTEAINAYHVKLSYLSCRYCPDNKEDKYHADFASITLLKQLRSSVGKKGISSTPGVIGGPAASLFAGGQVPPSRRPQMQHVGGGRPSASFQNHVQPSSPSDINMRNLRGPNAAWTRPTNQPCMSQMYGNYC